MSMQGRFTEIDIKRHLYWICFMEQVSSATFSLFFARWKMDYNSNFVDKAHAIYVHCIQPTAINHHCRFPVLAVHFCFSIELAIGGVHLSQTNCMAASDIPSHVSFAMLNSTLGSSFRFYLFATNSKNIATPSDFGAAVGDESVGK